MQKSKINVRTLYSDFIKKISQSPLTNEILIKTRDGNDTPELYEKVIRQDNAVQQHILFLSDQLSISRPAGSMSRDIALLGIERVRNYILTVQLLDHFGELSQTNFQTITSRVVSETLVFAIEAQHYAENLHYHCRDVAFTAGIVFDIMRFILKKDLSKVAFTTAFLQGVFRHSLETAFIASTITSYSEVRMEYSKYSFGAGLLHDIGKIAILVIAPEEYQKLIDLNKTSMRPMYDIEKLQFDLTHDQIASLLLKQMTWYSFLMKPVEFHHEYKMSKSHGIPNYDMAMLLYLANTIYHNSTILLDEKDLRSFIKPFWERIPIQLNHFKDVIVLTENHKQSRIHNHQSYAA